MTDLLGTTAQLLGAQLPDDGAEDSISFLPVLLGQETTALRKMNFIQGDTGDNAIAVGFRSLKLVESTNSNKEKVHQLYNLSMDQGETNDVAEECSDVVRQMAAALNNARTDGRTRY